MPFELHNKRKRAVDCCIRGKWGCYKVPGETFFPSVEEEASGLTAEMFADVVPNLLAPTPPPVRRRLLVAAGLEVPADIVKATAHLAEFGGHSQDGFPSNIEEVETSGKNGQETVVHKYTKVENDAESPQRPERASSYDDSPKPVVSEIAPTKMSQEIAAEEKEVEEAAKKVAEVVANEMDKITSRQPDDDMVKLKPGKTTGALDAFAEEAEKITTRSKRSGEARRKKRGSYDIP